MKTQPAGISSLCRRTDRLLWEAYARSECQSNGSSTDERCRLLFPRYRKEDLRVSEQEARFAFVEALCKGGQFRYSVETPTRQRYQFSGQTPLSAQTDLTVYDRATRCRRCNVEFKAGGISPSAKTKKSIYKDVEKLLREKVWGLWFHLLENTNSSTIPNFLGVIGEGIQKVRAGKECIEAEGLTIHVCVLRQGFSLHKEVLLNEADLERHLEVDLHVTRKELVKDSETKLNGWKLNVRGLAMPTNP